eukprot:7577443-Prorocentrum_lima.AAC.1
MNAGLCLISLSQCVRRLQGRGRTATDHPHRKTAQNSADLFAIGESRSLSKSATKCLPSALSDH